MADPKVKKLKIQTGVVKRLGKEKLSYRKEADKQKDKIQKMIQDEKPQAEIKKMTECMEESLMMIPDCHRRLEKSIPDLKQILSEFDPEEFAENEDYKNAVQVLSDVEQFLKVE